MKRTGLSALALCIVAGPALANNYPTDIRVAYVMDCMSKRGGANYTTMYQCSCSIDQIARVLSYDDFVEADTYTRGRRATGERGGVLREGARARQMRTQLAEAERDSFRTCFPGQAAQAQPNR